MVTATMKIDYKFDVFQMCKYFVNTSTINNKNNKHNNYKGWVYLD